MKFMHLSDLHFGKRVNEYSMIEDQKYIIKQILDIVETENTDGVLIAGDIYDRKDPSIEAVSLFDDLLVQLSARNQRIFIVSGNHDSAERIAYAGRLLEERKIHISPVYDGSIAKICLEDEYGIYNVYLLPFIKPVHVSRFYPEEEINDYTDAIKVALSKCPRNQEQRNILVMHQYVTGAIRCESEEISIGGLDDVNAEVITGFDYVALGHLHGPQKVGQEHIRYSGTPLKYSFSEESHHKSVTIVEMKEKGNISVRQVALHPLRDLKTIRGTFEELTSKKIYEKQDWADCYLHVVLTDEEDVPNALGSLKKIYPYIMRLDYDNTRTRASGIVEVLRTVEEKSPLMLFSELYTAQNGQKLTSMQEDYLKAMMEDIWES